MKVDQRFMEKIKWIGNAFLYHIWDYFSDLY
jgi:hypothetical protein